MGKMNIDIVHKFNLEMMKTKEEGNYLKNLKTTSVPENFTYTEGSFASSIPSQDFFHSPLLLAWDCLKKSVSRKDSNFNKDIYKEYLKRKD